MSLKKRAINGLLLQQVAAAVQVFLQLITLAILARFLSPQDFGVFSIATVCANFAGLISQVGVGPALVQRERLTDRHVSTGFTLSLAVGLVLAGFLYVSAPMLATYYAESKLNSVLRFVSVTFVISSAGTVSLSILQRRLEFRRYVVVNLAAYAFGYCLVSIGMALTGYGVWALVGGTLAQAVVKLVLSFVLSPHRLSLDFSLPVAKELLTFGAGFTLARIFNYLATHGDYMVLGRIGGAAVLGIYSRAYQLMVLPASQIGSVLERVLFPLWARAQSDKALLARYYLVASGGLSAVTMVTSALLLVSAPEVIRVVLGPQWEAAIIPFQIMSLVLFARTGYKLSDSLAKATGAVYSRATRELVYAVMVVVSTWLGYQWGIVGVSVGVSLAILTNWVVGLALSCRILGLTWADMARIHRNPVMLGLGMAGLTWVIRETASAVFSSSPIIVLIITVGLGLSIIVGVSVVAPSVLGREMVSFLLNLMEMVNGDKHFKWIRKRLETALVRP